MKLTELEPRWLEHDGQRVAIMFLCPHCAPAKRTWLSCFFVPAGTLPRHDVGDHDISQARYLFQEELRKMGYADPENDAYEVVGCNSTSAWVRNSDDLETVSITPSLDASASGHWHGYITNGDIL